MEAVLEAVRRDQRGRNEAGRLRREGRIPAVLYGGGVEGAEALAVDPVSLREILYSDSGVNTLISLKVDGGEETRVLIREFQVDPVHHALLHADFYRVAMDKVLEVTVPIKLVGEAIGVKDEGGIVDFVHRELEIECLPTDIPEHISVDISELTLHKGVRVRDLAAGTWTPLSEPDMLIVHVVPPRVEAEPEAEAEAAEAEAVEGESAEPEVIKKGKGEDEGSEAKAKAEPSKDKD